MRPALMMAVLLAACAKPTPVVEPEPAKVEAPKPSEPVIPVLGLELGLPDRPTFLVPAPAAVGEDGSWSILGLRSVLDDLLRESEQGRVVIVSGYVQEIYQPPTCPPDQLCPPAKQPHMWIVDNAGVAGKRLALMVVGNEYPIPDWDVATQEFFADAPVLELEVGHRYAFMGWFRRFTDSGFGHDAGLLELLAATEFPVRSDSVWIVPINSPHHPRIAAAEGRDVPQPVFAQVPASVAAETNFADPGPLVEPRDGEEARDLGEQTAKAGLPLRADYYYRWMIVDSPDAPDGWAYLANFYADYGHGEVGESVLEVAIARRPDDPDLYNGLGRLYLNLTRPELACRAYERAIELAPDKPDALFGLGMAYAEAGERERAVEVLERFLEVGGDAPEHVRMAAKDTISRMQPLAE